MKTTLVCFLLSAIVVLTAAAADVTGKWTGNIAIENNDPEPAMLILKQDGASITGSGGPNDGEQWPIKTGKIAGNKITLEIPRNDEGVYKLELVIDGDKMTGDVTATRGDQTMKAKLDVTRAK